jgi:hypothetical protein
VRQQLPCCQKPGEKKHFGFQADERIFLAEGKYPYLEQAERFKDKPSWWRLPTL